MTDETWRRLEAFHAEQPGWLAGPVPPEEVDAASTELGLPLPADYGEFLRRYGGGMVGFCPIRGLREVEVTDAGSTVIEENRRYRDQGWPGVSEWVIITSDHGGNPIGIAPDGRLWVSNRDRRIIKTEAEDLETFLNCCLDVFYHRPQWHMIEPAVAARPADPRGCLALFALSEASRYDIWDGPVMVQTLWSETLEERVLLWPLDEAALGWSSNKRIEPIPDWRIEVRLPWVRDPVPAVAKSGTLRPLDAASHKAMLAKAVLVLCRQLVWSNSRFRWPMIIRVSETSEGYGVMFEWLPRVIGEDTWYGLSRDLQHYEVPRLGGR